MRNISLSGVGLIIIVALVAPAIARAATFPLPQMLPAPTGGTHFTALSDGTEGPTLETANGESLGCGSATSEGGQGPTTGGTYRIDFEGCKEAVLGTTCSTIGDAAGVILNTGSFHYVVDTLGATLGANGVAVLFLPSPSSFECDAGLTKFKVTGKLLCLMLEPLVSRKTHLFHCVQSSGVQSEERYWNDNGTIVGGVSLEISKNGGTFQGAGELSLFQGNAPEPVAIMNE